jgi:hypothetical protein
VAGYIARGLLKRVKCESCPGLLVKSRDAPAIELSDEVENHESARAKEDFLKAINRGGLVTPSELVYVTCLHALQLREEIFSSDDVFLQSANPRLVFVETLNSKIFNSPEVHRLLSVSCDNCHMFLEFVPTIAMKLFNVFLKNFIATINDEIHAA